MWTSSQIAPPQVSVVICTRNRVSSLDMALKSLQQAAARTEDVSIELVVVDNGKPAVGTRTLVEAFATQSSFIIRVIPEAYPGLARARNTGLRAAAGEIIVLTDDDCCVAPDYFVQLRALYADVTGPVIIGGRVDLGTTADLPLTIKTEDQAARFNGVGVGGFILGCKMTLMRAVVAALGPVDERLGARSLLKACEDTDYVSRLAGRHPHCLRAPAACRPFPRAADAAGGAHADAGLRDRQRRPLYQTHSHTADPAAILGSEGRLAEIVGFSTACPALRALPCAGRPGNHDRRGAVLRPAPPQAGADLGGRLTKQWRAGPHRPDCHAAQGVE
ncbi:glycosyltransferase family 2 protein [Methylobacterium sp. Leaf361]|uniref:glycosyltransferase family 2 protein n=1 Tax=Methylobacterium sp. Leaf361 TaxID=1736352 RepID=UPI00244EE3B2|nr:glycosyltransferase family 2 protein [Methylobacterium sp. Leaf361]